MLWTARCLKEEAPKPAVTYAQSDLHPPLPKKMHLPYTKNPNKNKKLQLGIKTWVKIWDTLRISAP